MGFCWRRDTAKGILKQALYSSSDDSEFGTAHLEPEESVESCMLEWEEVPPGCLVVSGQLGAAWDRWARVMSVSQQCGTIVTEMTRITCGQNKKGRIKSAANNQSLIDFSA